MINKIIGPIFILCLILEKSHCQIDTVTYKVNLKEHSVLKGQILRENSDSIILHTSVGKILGISKNDIKNMQGGRFKDIVDTKKDLINIGYMVDNAYPTPKGKIVIISNSIIFSKIQYGLNDHMTLQCGTYYLPSIDNDIPQFGIKGLYHKQLNNKLNFASTVGFYESISENTYASHLGAIITFGEKSKNISFGVQKSFNLVGSLTKNLPLYDLTAKYTFTPQKKIAIAVETYFSKFKNENQFYVLPSMDVYSKYFVFSITINAIRFPDRFAFLPFIGFKLPLNYII